MNRSFPLLTLLFFFSILSAQTIPAFLWARQLGAGSISFDPARSALDAAGNLYTMGSFWQVADFDPGPGTYTLDANNGGVFISKMSSAGALLWVKQLQLSTGSSASCLTTDSYNNVYVAGIIAGTSDLDPGPGVFTFNADSSGGDGGNLFILKLNQLGDFVWVRQINSVGHTALYLSQLGAAALKVDAERSVYVTGTYWGNIDFDPGPGTHLLTSEINSDAYTVKLDSLGHLAWVASFSSNSYDNGIDLTVDELGNVYSTGNYWGGVNDFDPGQDTLTLQGHGNGDVYITKLDKDGHLIWAKGFGGGSMDYSSSIGLDAQHNVYTAGTFNTTCDFDPSAGWAFNLQAVNVSTDPTTSSNAFISKLDADGNFAWAKSITAISGDGMAVNAAGDAFVIGQFADTVDFDPGPPAFNMSQSSYYAVPVGNTVPRNSYLLKLNHFGNFEWATKIGDNEVHNIALNSQNEIYVAGNFRQKVDFDPGPDTCIFTIPTPFGAQRVNGYVSKFGATVDGIHTWAAGNEDVSVYPNPTNGIFNLSVSPQFNAQETEVYNSLSQRVYAARTVPGQPIDLAGQPEGLYIVKVRDGSGTTVSRKLVKH